MIHQQTLKTLFQQGSSMLDLQISNREDGGILLVELQKSTD